MPATFAIVIRLFTRAPALYAKVVQGVSATSIPAAQSFEPKTPRGNTDPISAANPAATVARPPVCVIRKYDHPQRKAQTAPMTRAGRLFSPGRGKHPGEFAVCKGAEKREHTGKQKTQ